MTEFHFLHPEWLLAGGGAVLLLWTLAALNGWRRRRALKSFGGARLGAELARSVSGWRRALKLALLTGGVAALFGALAQPRWGYRLEETERRGVDILFAVDTSRSMLANDLRPDRLTRAKLAVSDLVGQFDGDRAGLVAFAGESFLQVPMTVDRDVFERSLAELDTNIIPHGGSDLGAAIREATAAFGDVSDEKLLVLITDGENLEGDAIEAARRAAEAGVRIFTVGVGSADGALLEVPGPNGPTLVRDEQGQPVRSRLDEATLREIADVTGGAYEPLGASGTGLSRLYAEHLSQLPRHAVAARQHKVFHERFQWPLGLGILLLLLEPLIGERRRFGLRKRARRSTLAPAGAAAAVLLASTTAFAQDYAISQRLWQTDAPDPREAERAYERGDYQAAREVWEQSAERSARAEHRFNAGAAAYRAGDWDAAAEAFEGAVRAGDPSLQQRAYYDLGNAQFQRGRAALESDREAAKAAWRDAIESYESTLALDGADADARHNLDVVRRALDALEQAEQEEAADDSDEPQSGGDDQQSQDSGGEGQQSQDSGGEGQQSQDSGGEGQQSQDSDGQGQQSQDSDGQGQQSQDSGGEGQQSQDSGGEGQQSQDSDGQGQQDSSRADGDAADQQGSSGDGSSEQRGAGREGEERDDAAGSSQGPRKEADRGKETSSDGDGAQDQPNEPDSGEGSEGGEAEGDSEEARDGRGSGLRKRAQPKDRGEPNTEGGDEPDEPRGEDRSDGEPRSAGAAGGEEQDESEGEEGAAEGEREGAAEDQSAASAGAADGEPTDDENAGVAFAGSTGPGEDVGRLSRDQAVQLLRSLRHEQRRFPLTGRRSESASDGAGATRNW